MTANKLREEFEAAYAERAGCNTDELKACRWGDKGYRDPFAASAWFGWIDSRAALVVDLPRVEMGWVDHQEVIEAIESAGVRVKP